MAPAFPFVGRAKERAELLMHIRAAAAGRGRLLLLGGEAGAGKTALLRAVLTAHSPLTVTGRCPGPQETPPFGPWAEAVRRLRHELGWETDSLPLPFGDAPAMRSVYELSGLLSHWFGHRCRPLVLVLEDLHWSDAASLDLLRHLTTWLPDWPVLVIATYRTDELSRHHPLWSLLPELLRAGAARVLLDRLTREEVAELVDQTLPPELSTRDGTEEAGRLAALLHGRTAGLALFVREMLDLVIRTRRVPGPSDPLPQTLQQVIDSKLDRLSANALDALQPATVIGERFSFNLLAQVAEMAEEELSAALEAAIARHVIRPLDTDGDWFAFDHALFRESLLARQIGSRRRRWHARIAEAMLAGPDPDSDTIAYHLTRAGDPRAVKHLIQGGDSARTLGALAQAQERYEQALSLLPVSHPDPPELLLKLAWCLGWGDPERAGIVCQQAREAAEASGDKAVALWARHLALTLAAGNSDSRFQVQASALIAAEEPMLSDPRYQRLESELYGGPAGYPRATSLLLRAYALGGSPVEARALLQESSPRALPGASGDIISTTVVLALLGGRLGEAADQCHRAYATARRLRRYHDAIMLLRNELLTRLAGPAEPPEELDLLAAELRELEDEAWQRTGYAYIKRGFSLTGVYLYYRGDWQGAYHHVVEAARQERGRLVGSLAWHAGRMLLSSGDPAAARTFAEAVPPFQPADSVAFESNVMVMAHALRAEVYLALGEPARARAWLDAAERWPALGTAPFYRASVRLARAAYHRVAGDPDGAWREAMAALADARSSSSRLGAIHAHRLLGELAAARADGKAAAEHFQSALEQCERCRFPFEAALVRLARGRSLGGAPGAAADLGAACACFEAAGAATALAAARKALEEAAAAPAPSAPPMPDGLTPREGEVVALVCQGLTDREIAARLFISHKTVDRHLRNIFNKTGVTNRAALVAYASSQGLLG